MSLRTRRRPALAACSLLALATWLIAPLAAAAEPVAAGQLAKLASEGEYEPIIESLRQSEVAEDPEIERLLEEADRFAEQKAALVAKRRAAFNEAVQQMHEHLEADRVEDALVRAIEAHGLAADPAAFLVTPDVRAAVAAAERNIAKATEAQDWLEVIGLYRALDLLFENHGVYHEELLRANRRLQVLRLYAPDALAALIEARAERRAAEEQAREGEGEADPEVAALEREAASPPTINDETWQQQLKGVDLQMLRQTLTHAKRRHVDDPGYGPLLAGAVGALQVLADTPAVAKAFPSLSEPAKVARFKEGLNSQIERIEQRGDRLHFLDAAHILDAILAANNRSVDLPPAVLVYEMTEGLTGGLDDFSGVIWPRETETFRRNFEGNFSGVGIQITLRDGRLTVVSPLADTPAQRAGIKAGDTIVSVDGDDTTAWSLDHAVSRITGERGTPVVLGIERVGEEEPLRFKLIRAEIPIESVRGWSHRPDGAWNYYIDSASRIGYVRLSQFIPQTATDLDAAINQMQDEGGVNGLILDLRFNPGGLLSGAVDVADRFIRRGDIVSTVGPNGELMSRPARARADRTYDNFPVVILINEGSASASEIVAGALQDYQRALIVGTRSFGKGSVQDVVPLDAGAAYLKLTTQYYRLPGGRIIHRKPNATTWGIEPDVEVKMTPDEVAKMLELRQEADVLRDEQAILDDAEATFDPQPLVDEGIDPQLVTGLLVLRSQLVADRLAKREAQQVAELPGASSNVTK